MLLWQAPKVRTSIDTGGRKRDLEFEVAVLCLIFLKILFSFATLYFVSGLFKNILCGTWRQSTIARILRIFRGYFSNIFLATTVSLKNNTENRRHSISVKFLALVTVIRILKSTSKFSRQIPISFLVGVKNYIRYTSIINTLLLLHQISEPPLWMLHLYVIFFKNLSFSSILFVNNSPFRYMYYSSVVSKTGRETVVPISTNKCLIPSARRKLQPNNLQYLTIGLSRTDICFLWFSLIIDSGSRKWWNNQGLSKNLGPLYKHPTSAYEGDVSCGQYMYKVNKDSKHSSFNTNQQVTFVLFVTSSHLLLLWNGNDRNEDMVQIVTAKNRVDKNVRTFVASLLPLCLVMLV